MFPHLGWFVFRVEDSQLGEHAHMCPLQAQRSLEELDQFLKVAPVLVVVDELFQFVGVDHDVETAHLGQTELLAVYAREAYLRKGRMKQI